MDSWWLSKSKTLINNLLPENVKIPQSLDLFGIRQKTAPLHLYGEAYVHLALLLIRKLGSLRQGVFFQSLVKASGK